MLLGVFGQDIDMVFALDEVGQRLIDNIEILMEERLRLGVEFHHGAPRRTRA